jgi:hypothetical protein
MSVALSVVFTGLCALVTDGEHGPAQVLLVDAPGLGEVAGVALPEHAPTLVASLASLANPETSGPSRIVTTRGGAPGSAGFADQIGIWDLTGAEVSVRFAGGDSTVLELFRGDAGGSAWPEPPPAANDPSSWRDLRYVVDMAALTGDGRVDPELVAPDRDGAAALPRGVSARFRLDAGRLEGGLPSQADHRDDVFEFRGRGASPRLRQAMTDSIRWSLEADTDAIVIEIAPVNGRPVRRLVFAAGAAPHDVFVSNLPAEIGAHDAHHGLSSEQMVALHFGAYYRLLRNEPADQPLPWLSDPPRPSTGFGRPAFCGPAVFSRR